MIKPKLIKQFLVEPGTEVNLKDYVTDWTETDEAKELGKDVIKERAAEILEENRRQLAAAQELLYASDTHSVLLIFQAMDAAGKDGTIRHVMSGVNPQGCQVFSFKKPSAEELDHNFLWRYMKALPERGRIGIFNRSYYEDVLVVKVHPEWLGPGQPAEPGQEVLGEALRGHQQLRETPVAQRHAGAQVLPPRLQGRAEAALPRTPDQPGKALEVLRGRPGGARALEGLSEGVRGRHLRHQHQARAVVCHPGRPQIRRPRPGGGHHRHRHSGSQTGVPQGSPEKMALLDAAREKLEGKDKDKDQKAQS